MSPTPAAHLAELQAAYPSWSIGPWPEDPAKWLQATRLATVGELQILLAMTPAELEELLAEKEADR